MKKFLWNDRDLQSLMFENHSKYSYQRGTKGNHVANNLRAGLLSFKCSKGYKTKTFFLLTIYSEVREAYGTSQSASLYCTNILSSYKLIQLLWNGHPFKGKNKSHCTI